MLTISRARYGAPEDLQLINRPIPTPRAGEILVKVHAVSVNLSDWEFMVGRPYYVRGFGLVRPKFKILGSDVAGVVAAVGKGSPRSTRATPCSGTSWRPAADSPNTWRHPLNAGPANQTS